MCINIRLIGYLFYKIAARKDYENKYYDYRALAEGLRVQFFWKLIHSKENTYDHYLRKYMGEMDWIFQTVRNVCMDANQEISQNPSACKKGVCRRDQAISAHDGSL